MDHDHLADLLPLALGHDQEASACPWVQLTRRTSAYPSRIAQSALLVARGTTPITPDLVDQLYRCDDCGRCRAHSILPGPPDLPHALWQTRASLVAADALPEVLPFATALQEHGSIYGDLRSAFARLGAGDAGADILFVPGAATLFHDREAARAALSATRSVCGSVDLQPDLIDSGHVARELGLASEAETVRDHLRRRVAEVGYRLVVAGTPKEAFGLREALAGIPTEVFYAGSEVARVEGNGAAPGTPPVGADLRVRPVHRRDVPLGGRADAEVRPYESVVFHPSETLLHRLDAFDAIDHWLRTRVGETYIPEPDPKRNAWPAAIERPAIRVPNAQTRALAEQRMEQLLKLGDTSSTRRLILTCDPFSLRALRDVAPPKVTVMDLLVAATNRFVSIEEENPEE